ncbi:TlpA family protein disulfide reductase [Dokdonia ponticola]|uniref:TlpA family protein disulfide reductase n=1 Tax=Dokdonia ponticola TaxID=2041041 RepID=A0ABV9I138_9FLAO
MIFRTTLQLICICFLMLITSCKNDTTATEKSIIEGLTEVPQSEWGAFGTELDNLKFFDRDGTELSEEETDIYLSSGAQPKLYTDENDILKLGIIEPPTEEEKKVMEEMMARFQAEEEKLQESIGTPAWRFDLVDYDGKRVTSDDLKGKVTVVNFWFKECKPCIQEMPELNELVSSFKSNENVQFFGFSTTEKDQLPSFFEKHDFDYRIIPDSQSYAMATGVTGYPTNMIIDQQGNITFLKTGFIPGIAENIKKEIQKLL